VDCPAPSATLPENFQGARLREGVAHLERPDGATGCFYLPPGWYYSDAGRARIAAAVERWQVRLDEMQARLDSLSSAPTIPAMPHDSHLACSLAALACLVLGFAVGRFASRP